MSLFRMTGCRSLGLLNNCGSSSNAVVSAALKFITPCGMTQSFARNAWFPIKKGHASDPEAHQAQIKKSSASLSKKEKVYEFQFHYVKPPYMEDYLNQFQDFINKVEEKKTGAELVGSWTVEVGEQDEAIHLWKYDGGYDTLNHAYGVYRNDEEFVDYRRNRNRMLRSRKNAIVLQFSFWPEPEPRSNPDGSLNMYELRRHVLKSGSLLEWGNYWAQYLHTRTAEGEMDHAVSGFFTNIGEMYSCYHLWRYKDLNERKQSRERTWRHPGWNTHVSYTVPLLRNSRTNILIPTPFSKLR